MTKLWRLTSPLKTGEKMVDYLEIKYEMLAALMPVTLLFGQAAFMKMLNNPNRERARLRQQKLERVAKEPEKLQIIVLSFFVIQIPIQGVI